MARNILQNGFQYLPPNLTQFVPYYTHKGMYIASKPHIIFIECKIFYSMGTIDLKSHLIFIRLQQNQLE